MSHTLPPLARRIHGRAALPVRFWRPRPRARGGTLLAEHVTLRPGETSAPLRVARLSRHLIFQPEFRRMTLHALTALPILLVIPVALMLAARHIERVVRVPAEAAEEV